MGRILVIDDARLLRGPAELRRSEGQEVAPASDGHDRLMMVVSGNGTAAKPSARHLARAATRSIGSPVRGAAIGLYRLVGGPIRRLASFISTWLERAADIRRLQSLDDHMLKDIGVSRCDVEREVRGFAVRRTNITQLGEGDAEH